MTTAQSLLAVYSLIVTYWSCTISSLQTLLCTYLACFHLDERPLIVGRNVVQLSTDAMPCDVIQNVLQL